LSYASKTYFFRSSGHFLALAAHTTRNIVSLSVI